MFTVMFFISTNIYFCQNLLKVLHVGIMLLQNKPFCSSECACVKTAKQEDILSRNQTTKTGHVQEFPKTVGLTIFIFECLIVCFGLQICSLVLERILPPDESVKSLQLWVWFNCLFCFSGWHQLPSKCSEVCHSLTTGKLPLSSLWWTQPASDKRPQFYSMDRTFIWRDKHP